MRTYKSKKGNLSEMSLLIPCLLLLVIPGSTSGTQVVNGTLGGSVYFYESVFNKTYFIQWSFKGVPIASHFPGFPPGYFNKCEKRCELYDNGTLRMDNLIAEDNGDYIFIVQLPPSTSIKEVTYELITYPVLSGAVLTSNATNGHPINGTHVSLHCDPGNQNVTSYTFHRNDDNICSQPHISCQGAYLQFKPITESDNGNYACTIQNPVSSSNSNTLRINVIVAVSDVKLFSNTTGFVRPGLDSVSLTCSAHGTDISYSWSLQGAPLSSAAHYHFSENNQVLTIDPVSDKDNGTFTCTASNLANNLTSNGINLNLALLPEKHINCTAEPNGQNLTLGCSWPGGQPAANVSLIFGNLTDSGQNSVTMNVSTDDNLQGSTLSCHGDQLGRTSECSLSFDLPKAQGFNSSTIKREVGEAINLRVTLEPGLPATFTWYHQSNLIPVRMSRKFLVQNTPSNSTLQIESVTLEDAGKYNCTAKNFIGTQSFLFTVEVSESVVVSKSSLDGGTIAGIVVGVLAGVTLIGILVFFIVKKKKRSQDNKGINKPEDQQETSVQYATMQRENGGVAQTSLDDDQQEDDVKYAVIKFPNNNSTKAPVSPPVETEYSTVKHIIKQ